ncbi:MAG: sigma-70 family RNA polymerase sigma factor [Acidobacteriia bacterium]|nr:sigma-70 family RNA polymerase sigma factor [Terriglobia bacterium]
MDDAAVLAPREFTQLLVNWRNGDKNALDQMTPVLYDELRRLARHFLAAERPDHTLQPTALVHEAYMRLVDQRSVDWKNRAHFLGVAASMMRRILINHARANQAAKREGFTQAIALEDALGVFTNPQIDLLELNKALQQLADLDPQQGRVVELRYFGGLTIEETAEVMGISPATVKREWGTARLWLMQQIEGPPSVQ